MKSTLFTIAAAFSGMILGTATATATAQAGAAHDACCSGFKPAVVAGPRAAAVAHRSQVRIRSASLAVLIATVVRGKIGANRVRTSCTSHGGKCRRDHAPLVSVRDRARLGARNITAESPESFVANLEHRALAAMQEGETAAAQQWRFRQLYRQYFDTEACARAALGPYWQQATTEQRQEFINRYEDYVVITYSLPLGQIEAQSFTVLGSQSDQDGVIVISQINGVAPLKVDWRLNPTAAGYKVTNVIVNGIDMAKLQRSDMVSVIQRNSGQMQPLLVALREKNATNGITR